MKQIYFNQSNIQTFTILFDIYIYIIKNIPVVNHKFFFFRASNDIVRANGRHLIGLGAVLSAPGDQLGHGSHLRRSNTERSCDAADAWRFISDDY